jgi:hypothetical protein
MRGDRGRQHRVDASWRGRQVGVDQRQVDGRGEGPGQRRAREAHERHCRQDHGQQPAHLPQRLAGEADPDVEPDQDEREVLQRAGGRESRYDAGHHGGQGGQHRADQRGRRQPQPAAGP